MLCVDAPHSSNRGDGMRRVSNPEQIFCALCSLHIACNSDTENVKSEHNGGLLTELGPIERVFATRST